MKTMGTLWLTVAALAVAGAVHSAEDSGNDAGLRVRVFAGGSSVFTFTSNQVQWLHRVGSRPGEAEGKPKEDVSPTFLNDTEWQPEWIGPMSLRHKVPFALPESLAKAAVRMQVVEGRGRCEARKTDTTVLVEVDDSAVDGGPGMSSRSASAAPWDRPCPMPSRRRCLPLRTMRTPSTLVHRRTAGPARARSTS